MQKICRKCGNNKDIEDFHKCGSCKDRHVGTCKSCKNLRTKIRYYNNIEEERAKKLAYHHKNKENCNKKRADRIRTNRDSVNRYNRERFIKYPHLKIERSLRSRFLAALLSKNVRKDNKVTKIIGCSIKDLKSYLESKFLPTMSWENYGKYWHIDHIIPCVKFNLAEEEEQRKCFNYTNLQPLFAVTQVICGVVYIGNLNKSKNIILC